MTLFSQASHRRSLISALAVLSALTLTTSVAAEGLPWVGTWTADPQSVWGADFAFPTKVPDALDRQTFRQVVRISLGGSSFRVVLSNAYGEQPVRVGEVTMAALGDGTAASVPHPVTFGGRLAFAIPPGASAVSDAVNLPLSSLGRAAISIFLPERTPVTTFHWDGKQTAVISEGDTTNAIEPAAGRTTKARIILSAMPVQAPATTATIVAMGDSITDGNGSTPDADHRWPDFLAQDLAGRGISVLNAGISGARLLSDRMGVNAAARFDHDVADFTHVRAIVLLMGINDIAWPGTIFAPDAPPADIEAMIAAYRQIATLARVRGLKVIGGTLTPFEGALPGTSLAGRYYTADKDALRRRVNDWIRHAGAFDAVVDFDELLRDPANPLRLLPAYDSGDHLHPGDAGNEAMALAVAHLLREKPGLISDQATKE